MFLKNLINQSGLQYKHMKTFNSILSEMFSIEESEIQDTLTSNDIPDWDSMNYIFFISELEKHFGIVFTMDEVMAVETVGDLRRIVEERSSK